MEADSRTHEIRESLLSHDREFHQLLCMIPPKYYISPPEPCFSDEEGSKKKNKKNKKQTMSAEEKRIKKRARFDPDTPHTIPQLQGLNTYSKDAADPSFDEDSPERSPPPTSKLSNAPQLSRSELQAKLQRRIVELQHQGATTTSHSKADTVSASGSSGGAQSPPVPTKDALLDLGRQKRGEMRDRRRRELKETRRQEREAKAEQILLARKRKGLLPKKANGSSGMGNLVKGLEKFKDDDTANALPSTTSTPNKSNVPVPMVVDASAPSTEKPNRKPSSTPNAEPTPPKDQDAIQTDAAEPDLTFSALAFETGPSHPPGKRTSKNPSWTSKNPAEAKIAIDRRQAYLDKLTPEARERAEESKKWEKAGLQASGTKVMDDPKKLEKALKRSTKEKRKKREAWNDRKKAVEKLQEDKQKKRRDNIEKRKEQIRDKKKGGVKAKGNTKSVSGGKMKKSVKGF